MVSLNCSDCGKPHFKSKKLKCKASSNPNSIQNNTNQNVGFKNKLNCSGCGSGTHVGNKFNKVF